MAKTKTSKLKRKRAKPIRLTARDIEIIRALHRHRFLTTDHLQKLTGTESRWAMNARLRLLYDHKYIDRPQAQKSLYSHSDKRPVIYALGNKGASLLSTRSGISMPKMVYWTEKNRRVREAHIEHTLGIADFVLGIEIMCQEKEHIEFIDPQTIIASAIKVSVPFGFLEERPRMDQRSFYQLLENNRDRYCWRYTPQASALEISFPGMEPKLPAPIVETKPEPAPMPPMVEVVIEETSLPTGRGGEDHVKIQNAIKSIANQYGWRAGLEHQVADGAVDVWLEREGLSIACEINVTTRVEYEQQNIRKCLNASADEVWIIGEDRDKLLKIGEPFRDRPNVYLFSPDDIPAEIEARSDMEASSSSEVRGYTVSVKKAYVTELDLNTRRARLDAVFKSNR